MPRDRRHSPSSPARRNFLGGRWQPVLLPWSDTGRAVRSCTGCGACAEACPQEIVAVRADGLASVVFGAECTFCGACAEACPEDVFDRSRVRPWQIVATVTEACLEHRGIACRACEDACPERAIRTRPRPGGRNEVIVSTEACSGCGACAAVCPADAVTIGYPERDRVDAA